MSALKLVQVSDLHLQATPDGLYRETDVEARWHSVLTHICDHHADADLLLLSGDLVHHAGVAAYQRLHDSLACLPVAQRWLPGNHDTVTDMAQVVPAEALAGSWSKGCWQVVTLDSTSAPDGRGGGELSDQALQVLAHQLNVPQATHQLLVLHHNPVPVGSRWQDAIGLRNADRFWQLVATGNGVRAVLFGHVHQAWQFSRADVHLFSAPAVAPQFKAGCESMTLEDDPALSGPGYAVYRLHPDGTVDVDVVRLCGS